MKTYLRSPVTVGLVLIASTMAVAFSGGPPPARTGAPGDADCTGCHTSFPLNSGDGLLTVTAPATYITGQTYTISVDLRDPGQERWGFQITALDAADQPAGTLEPIDSARTQKQTSGGREYVNHTSTGTDDGTPDIAPGWIVQWTADNGVSGDVTFYCAGNAANSADGNQGDFIYTTSVNVTEEPAPPCCLADRGNVDGSGDDAVTLGDLTIMVDHLFISLDPIDCWEEGNLDGSLPEGPGSVTLADLTILIDHLFISLDPLPACP
ncbi:hypothetical protein GF377_01245 [candidate division GN15 bacterium]|nr:hypothetical protein [candidate division GN15 bacterium]